MYSNLKVIWLLCPWLKSSTSFNGKIATQGIEKEMGIFTVKFFSSSRFLIMGL